jgi:hypothetical protein
MKTAKIFQLLLVLVLTASISLIASLAYTHAQTSAPTVPQFTLQFINGSYYVPPVYGTNPYTGQTTITRYGYEVNNKTIEMTIYNQPFTPSTSGNQTNQLYYNIRVKGHYENVTSDSDVGSFGQRGLAASSSSNTVVTFNVQNWGIPDGGQVDFQVQAFIGYTYYNEGECYTANIVTVGESNWSNIQTMTFNNGTATLTSTSPALPTPIPTPTATPYSYTTVTAPPVQNPTPTPTATAIPPNEQKGVLPGFDWEQTALVVMAFVIAVLVVALIIVTYLKRSSQAESEA